MTTPTYTPPVTETPAAPAVAIPVAPEQPTALKIYSRSPFFYWWPMWAVGYILAVVSWLGGVPVSVSPDRPTVLMSPNQGLGLFYCVVFFLVLVITNVSVRGVWSLVVVLAVAFLALLFTYFGWWEPILAVLPHLAVYANVRFYVVISTMVLVLWLFSVLVSDRLSYWVVTPGQLTYHRVVGSGDTSYDTRGMVVEQSQQDLFRHWILGFGSGDIRISTTGARREELFLTNVLFVKHKVKEIQRLIAMKPDQHVAAPA